MPGGDRTGPMGMGPATGRGAGFCADFSGPGGIGPAGGPIRGFGRGVGGPGGGRRWRHWCRALGLTGWQRPATAGPAPTREQQADLLRDEAQSLQAALDEILRRIDQLQGQGDKADR